MRFLLLWFFLVSVRPAQAGFWDFVKSCFPRPPATTVDLTPRYLANFSKPETSPLLRVLFPEAYVGEFRPEQLAEALRKHSTTPRGSDAERREKGIYADHGQWNASSGDIVQGFSFAVDHTSVIFGELKTNQRFKAFLRRKLNRDADDFFADPSLARAFSREGYAAYRDKWGTLMFSGALLAENGTKGLGTADQKIRRFLEKDSTAGKMLYLAGVVQLYKQELERAREWDASLGDVPSFSSLEKKIYPTAFSPEVLYAGGRTFRISYKYGAGGEHSVFGVTDVETGKPFVLKYGRAFHMDYSTYELQQKIKAAGLPVVEMTPLTRYANLIEEFTTFGDYVLNDYIRRGESESLEAMIAFYDKLLRQSPLAIQDLKPSNIGRRRDGSWVINDFAFNIYPPGSQKIEGRISKAELGERIFSDLKAVRDASLDSQSIPKAEVEKNAKALGRLFIQRLYLSPSLEKKLESP